MLTHQLPQYNAIATPALQAIMSVETAKPIFIATDIKTRSIQEPLPVQQTSVAPPI